MGKRERVEDKDPSVYVYTEGLRTAEDKWEKYVDTRSGIVISLKGREGIERLLKEGKIREI